MSDENKRIVEINGAKVEFDLREARTVNTFKVGDTVKVLMKQYGDSYRIKPGVIVGLTAFEKLPSIEVAVLELDIQQVKLGLVTLNSQSKDLEIAHVDPVELHLSQAEVVAMLDRDIERKETELKTAKSHKDIVLNRFGQYMQAYDEAHGQRPA